VRPTSRIKAAVQSSVWIQPGDPGAAVSIDTSKLATDEQLAIRLERDGVYRAVRPGAWIKREVQASIHAVEPGNSVADDAVDVQEPATDKHLAVQLQNETKHSAIRPSARIKPIVQSSIGVESRDMVSADAVDGGKTAADEDPAIVL